MVNVIIKSKDKISGATIHFVDDKYDEGPIVLQKKIDVLKNDSAESLSKKILQIEYDLFLKAVTLFCEDKIRILNKKVIIDD